jgi:ribosomal-protein-alanine N-acetyltransferase
MLMAARITIGPFVPEDFGSLFCWANDTVAARHDFAFKPVDMMAHRQWWESLGKDPTKVTFAIRKTIEPAIIGYVQIAGINAVHRSAELGIRIGAEKNRGQGYGKEALALAVEFCWNHLNLNRLQLLVFKHNQRAASAYKAVGFKKEGLLRKAAFIDGEWVDVILMAALRPSRSRQKKQSPAGVVKIITGKTAASVTAVAEPHRQIA